MGIFQKNKADLQNQNRLIYKRNQNGQVSIFIALIFQILFLFFAAVINIGLLVHHKINLQNSVDLAAYYGATKQAEMLNSIAHINYQIRQSWKLLAWRYRALGTAGDQVAHPFNHQLSPTIGPRKPNADKDDGVPSGENTTGHPNSGIYNRPNFCITYYPFKPAPPNENTCKRIGAYDPDNYNFNTTNLFKPPPVITSLGGLSATLQAAAINALKATESRAVELGSINFLTLGNFYLNYITDTYAKRLTIVDLAKNLSQSDIDFFDINGDKVSEGVQKTLTKNLTYENNSDSLVFNFYNGLGKSTWCGQTSTQNEPPNWLKTIRLNPLLMYADAKANINLSPSGAASSISGFGRMLFFDGVNSNLPEHHLNPSNPYKDSVLAIKDLMVINRPDGKNPIIGFEKNPFCQAYVVVAASSKPKIPFSPIVGDIQLKALAVAKPFGGRIGPWYNKTWSDAMSPNGSGIDINAKTDIHLPPRFPIPPEPKDEKPFPNYSRYPGDQFGLQSNKVLYQYSKAIWVIGGVANIQGVNSAALNHTNTMEPNFLKWPWVADDLLSNSGQHDLLSWNEVDRWNMNDPASVKRSQMRWLELSAIAPDLFDLSYYSIEPDFYNNYFVKLKNGYFKKVTQETKDLVLRRDFGSRINDSNIGNELEGFSIKDQIKATQSYRKEFLDVKDTLNYIALKSGNLLNSWFSATAFSEDYTSPSSNENKTHFGKCNDDSSTGSDNEPILEVGPKQPPAPGSCVGKFQGRTGYSVKIQSINGFSDQILNKFYLDEAKEFVK